MRPLLLAALSLWLGGCATTSIKQSWRSPDLQNRHFQKIAIVTVEERGPIRQGFENRFVGALQARGQGALATYALLGLPEIKADKEAAAARVRAAGADAVLIMRLVDQSTYSSQMRATPALYAPTAIGYESLGWHDYYSIGFTDLGVVWSSSTQKIYLDCSLFDLTKGQRLWSTLTLTELKEDADRLAVADSLVAKVANAMGKDGVIAR